MGNGGEIVGFELSLHIPEAEAVTPVRYIMEPEYISQEKLNEEQEGQQIEAAKEAENWTVDTTDGTMYFYLNSSKGWRLAVADAAAGSRFYELERTEDGGVSWQKINTDPFEGMAGVSEGLIFFDDNFGFAGLSGAASSVSSIYMTEDGGATLTKLQLPMDTVTELPEHAEEYGLTLEDYDYLCMPEQDEDALTVLVVTAAGESEGLLFQSQDMGKTWRFAGSYKTEE